MNDYGFGNFLYALRSEKGFSQARLGEMLGVTNKAVSKWENGSAKPNTKLLPHIAEIFGVTVEELFACKRLEKDSELERIRDYLSLQKRKYAIFTSVFLSILLALPLLLIEFICVVMGFDLPDDVAGPLGAMGFILAFVVSITSFIIYRKNFKSALAPSGPAYSPRFVEIVKRGLLIFAIAWWYLLALMPTVYLLMLSFSSGFLGANIFLSVAVLFFIVLTGIFICFANIKRLLKIQFSKQAPTEKKRIRFSDLPLWGKVCYIAVIVLFPIVLNLQIRGFFREDLFLIKHGCMLIWLACEFALIFYGVKRKQSAAKKHT